MHESRRRFRFTRGARATLATASHALARMDPRPPQRLPRGFRFEAFGTAQALLVDGRVVADIMPLGEGRCRACLNPLSFSIRYSNFDSMDAAVAYVTDWAIQWEARLRDGVHVPSAL